MSNLTVTNATVVLPDQVLEHATVRVDDGRISAIEPTGISSVTGQVVVVDADGAWLIPGIVDLHNDNLEFEIHPRVNANMPLPFALSTMERRLAGAGVTTEFHSISFQDRLDKARSVNDATAKATFIAELDDSPRRAVRHNILHRLDVRTPGSLESALPSLRRVRTPYVSLNDHTPGQGQYRDVDRLIRMAEQQQVARGRKEPIDREWYLQRMRTNLADTETVPAFYASIAGELARTPMVIATHDDDTVEKVHAQLVLGATVNEFPITFEAAQYARDHGMMILVGAPNVLRGSSQSGNISARDLVEAGLADGICADYHAPCLIPAAFKLYELGLCDLPAAIAKITSNPANALGLTDRGEIAVGKLADLAIVRMDDSGIPQVEATFLEGRPSLTFARYPSLIADTNEPVFSMNGSQGTI
jgi:alpha-D-ribose 1-methylphosphonate 5-triphosphate diphosphatase